MENNNISQTCVCQHCKKASFISYIDTILKIIPILIFIFLIFNFTFNIGYFYRLGINFSSLLTIRDYYEGTAPFIAICIFLYMGVVTGSLQAPFLGYILDMFKLLLHAITILFWKILLIKFNFLIKYKYKSNKSYSRKKEAVFIRTELKSIQDDFFVLLRKHLKDIWNNLSTLFALLSPFYLIWFTCYTASKSISIIIMCLYTVLIFINLKVKNYQQKIHYLFFITLTILFFLGNINFLKDYKNSQLLVTMQEGQNYQVIRTIERGILVNDDSTVNFFDWGNVKSLNKKKEDLGLINNTTYLINGEIIIKNKK